jgi:hypothetical protein
MGATRYNNDVSADVFNALVFQYATSRLRKLSNMGPVVFNTY